MHKVRENKVLEYFEIISSIPRGSGNTKAISDYCVSFAKEHGVQIKTYDIIYKLVEAVEHAMKGMLDKTYSEKLTGKLEIRKIFKFSKVGLIAGCHVKEGTIKNNSHAKIIRDNVVVYDGKIKSLQHEKDSVKEVTKGMDCGLTLDACNDYKEGDIIEAYDLIENEI